MSQPIRHGGPTARERNVDSMKLRDIAGLGFPELREQLDGPVGTLEISGLSADSRKIAPGMAFVAVAGTKADGAGFVADAAARGAAVAVAAHAVEASIPVLVVESAPPFPVDRCLEFLRQAAGNDGGRHRYCRQDVGCLLHPPDLGSCRPSCGDDRHHRRRLADPQ
jgi:hypothetical protein